MRGRSGSAAAALLVTLSGMLFVPVSEHATAEHLNVVCDLLPSTVPTNATSPFLSTTSASDFYVATKIVSPNVTTTLRINVTFNVTQFPYRNAIDLRYFRYDGAGNNDDAGAAGVDDVGMGGKVYAFSNAGVQTTTYANQSGSLVRTWSCTRTLEPSRTHILVATAVSDAESSIKVQMSLNTGSPTVVNTTTGTEAYLFEDEDFRNGTLAAGYQEGPLTDGTSCVFGACVGTGSDLQAKAAAVAWKDFNASSCCLRGFFVADGSPSIVRMEGNSAGFSGDIGSCLGLVGGCVGYQCMDIEGAQAGSYRFTVVAHANAWAATDITGTKSGFGQCFVEPPAGGPVFPGGPLLVLARQTLPT
ncbi:MAG: hypothetical protein ACT4PT_02930 [Methanobacteriota archaeon]